MNYLTILNKKVDFFSSLKFNDKFISLEKKCTLNHWNSYFDTKNNIAIKILGRPTIETSEWEGFTEGEDAYISKFLIKTYISLGLKQFCNKLNGAFSIVIIEYNLNRINIITDKLGVYPIYVYGLENFEEFQVSSNIKLLIDNINKNLTMDEISIAEFLKKGFIYHPNSFYKEIKTLDNGTSYSLDFNQKKITQEKYFEIQPDLVYDLDYLVDKLSVALKNAIERRTIKYYGKKAIFLSGGSDSRTILTNSKDQNIEAITLYNNQNYEIKTAQRISKELRVKHQLIKRDKDYYFNAFDKSINLNGGRSLPTDDHFINLYDDERLNGYNTILTGCYADWMFKGIALNRQQLSLFGKIKLPLYKLQPFQYNFFSKRTLLTEKYEKQIKRREDNLFKNKDNYFNNESKRIFPLFQEETSATRLTLQQLFPWDPVFSDNDIIEVYQQIPIKYKLNSEVYDKAIAKLTKSISHIPHANKRHKIGINKYLGATIYLVNILKNKILRILKLEKRDSIVGEGSWISFKEYAKNQNIKNLWNKSKSLSEINKVIDVGDIHYDELIKKDYKLIYKMITLQIFFSNIKKGIDDEDIISK